MARCRRPLGAAWLLLQGSQLHGVGAGDFGEAAMHRLLAEDDSCVDGEAPCSLELRQLRHDARADAAALAAGAEALAWGPPAPMAAPAGGPLAPMDGAAAPTPASWSYAPAPPGRPDGGPLHGAPAPPGLRPDVQDALPAHLRAMGASVKDRGEAEFPVKPSPGSDLLWGGPSTVWTQSQFKAKAFAVPDITRVMKFAGPGSNIPESLWGVFWMDQYGQSSVAKEPAYPYKMVGTPEILASFGDTQYEAASGCVTPVPCYGGAHWAFTDTQEGKLTASAHLKQKNTLSFCYQDQGTVVIHQKMLKEFASVGPISVGGQAGVWALGFEDAGNEYCWLPHYLMDMQMIKTNWGWDRVTYVAREKTESLMGQHSWIGQMLLSKIHRYMPESHYPLIQIIDGMGHPTKWFAEFEQYMNKQKGDKMLFVNNAVDPY